MRISCCLPRWTSCTTRPAARLSNISVAQIYNLRATDLYQDQRVKSRHTRPSEAVSIGVRKAPEPEGRAGFIRIDSVHQGDYDGIKGVYHINAVGCVTQWEIVASCEKISEAYLLQVLEGILNHFHSRFWAYTLITDRNTSTRRWLSCWESSALSSPSPDPGNQTTMGW